MTDHNQPVGMLCRFRLKPDRDQAFKALLDRHWPTLKDAGLTTDEPARRFRAVDKAGNIAYIEMFSWRNGQSSDAAHESADVMSLWEPMGALCSDMEFWNVTSIPD